MKETVRLQLRPISVSDAPFLIKLMNAPKWIKHIGDRNVRTIDAAKAYIKERMDDNLEKKGFVNHVMIEKASGEPVGTCSLHDRDGVDGLDIGYALLDEFEGQGYAAEGANAMIDLARHLKNPDSISAITTEANLGSRAVLERLGFEQKGIIFLPKSTEEIMLYILKLSLQ